MKTFADVKRKMRPGTKWRCIHLFDNTDMGVRAVGKAQTNAVAFLKRLFWPKAKDIQIIDENTFIVTDNGRPMLKYIFVE